MRTSLLIFAGMFALVVSACSKVEFSKIKGPACQGFGQECLTENGVDYFDYFLRTEEPNVKTDILFVDDNSGSMRPEQANMAHRFPTFLDSINALDWRIGIVTTDMNGSGPTQDGNLLQFSGTSEFFILPTTPNVYNAFTNTIQRPETGYGDERGIYAAKRMLEKRSDRAMIRDDAHLAVVILSDEDERSNNGATPPPHGGPLESGKDFPDDLINFVNQTWSFEKSLTVHSIIIKPGDTSCYDQQKAQSGGTANYGTRYKELSDKTGGIVGTVCASDYGAQLADIGDVMVQTTESIVIACEPLPGTLVIEPGFNYELRGNKITFNPPLASGTQLHLKYQCESRQ